jgi:hypothetical protein
MHSILRPQSRYAPLRSPLSRKTLGDVRKQRVAVLALSLVVGVGCASLALSLRPGGNEGVGVRS